MNRIRFHARGRRLVVLGALAGLAALAGCGGGGTDEAAGGGDVATPAAADDGAEVEIAELDEAERQALSALDPDHGSTHRRYIVTFNPAAVAEAGAQVRSVAALDAHAAHRTRAAAAVQALTARTLAVAGPHAQVHAQFAHAVQGFAASVRSTDAGQFVQRLQAQAAVAHIELDRVVQASAETPVEVVDPGLGHELASAFNLTLVNKLTGDPLWGLDRLDQRRLPLTQTYGNTRDGSGVRAYIMDTGIQPHTEFGARLLAGFDGIGDGRGTGDCHGHGTHVAGTVGGTTYGVAPAVQLVPVRVLGCSGSSYGSSLLSGLDWIAAHGVRPAVVNMSLGGGASTALDNAVARLISAGFTVVVAAGNSNANACNTSPARLPAAITVGATDRSDTRAYFSNHGKCLDLFAPGTGITSAGISSETGTATLQGTSMAAPHVAGAAALLLQERSWLLPSQVVTQLTTQATGSLVRNAGSGSPNRLLYAGAASLVAFPMPHDIHAAVLGATGKASTSKLWTATATVKMVTEAGEPAKGVVVTAAVSNSAKALKCTTSASGVCTLSVERLSRTTVGTLNFALTGMSAAAQTYVPARNVASYASARRP